jgi:hypothetical protein
LRGYDPTPWLPTLAGVLVGSRADADRFLFDWRRTLGDLMASQHYGTVAKVAHERGLTLYGEALEDHRPSLGDDMAMRSHTDIPMSAMWTFGQKAGPNPSYIADIKGAASVAHIYGQNLVAAESMTSALNYWGIAAHPEACDRSGVRHRRQPPGGPHQRPSAGGRQGARPVADDLRPVLQPA